MIFSTAAYIDIAIEYLNGATTAPADHSHDCPPKWFV